MDRLTPFTETLKKVPLTAAFSGQIDILKERYGQEYIDNAENILELFELLGLDATVASRRYIFDYLKQLNYFLQNQDYGHSDFEQIKAEIYDDESTMLDTYMPGLLLSYAYTTILYEKNHVYLTEFLPRINSSMCGMEVGFGEGFYLWEVLKKYPDIRLTGFDISVHAIKFADRLLKTAGFEGARYELKEANIFEGLPLGDAEMDFATFAEVIEHIPNPEIGLREVVRVLKSGGILYLTTVMNSNHMDHISNFASVDEVRQLLTHAGLEICAEKIYHILDDFPDSQDISTGMAFVAKKR